MRSLYFIAVAAVAALVIGCGEQGGDVADAGPSTANKTKVVYCGNCGQIADTAICCQADATVCECGMTEGSPLCCVEIPEDLKGKNICSCGYEAGSENCCKEGAEVCSKCTMIKGSTMCCKIGVEGTGTHDHDHDHEGEHDHDHEGEGEGEGDASTSDEG
ncbi:MAG: hypothetical protein ACR2NP_17260 [Pirellulaceae bacterium]